MLRGPQGTLFGGGSEGGTIRYIHSPPSLTEYSSYGRAQWMSTRGGDPSYEAGLAMGGPIIEGKLGFRASVFTRRTGGYIDLTNYRNGAIYDENANNGEVRMGRVALTWGADRPDRTDAVLPAVHRRDRQPHLFHASVRSWPAGRRSAVLKRALHPVAAAKYTSSMIIPGAPDSRAGDLTIARDGQKFAQPSRTLDLGARFDFAVAGDAKAYVRIDYRWFDDYLTAVPGTAQFSPDSSRIPAQKNINLRLGLQWRAFDVSLFALNATDEQKGARTGGRSQCTNADCSAYNSYAFGRTLNAPTPRQIGIQVAYRP